MTTPTRHQFCPRHRIAYDSDLDPICPQCALQGGNPPDALNYDVVKQLPMNAAGELLDRRTLTPVG